MRTIGVGGSDAVSELAKIQDMTSGIRPIQKEEYQSRISKAALLIEENDFDAVYVHAGTSMTYFTGTPWHPSERMVGVLIFPDGSLEYISPEFEKGTLLGFMTITGPVNTWEEHESPYELLGDVLSNQGLTSGKIGLDEQTPFFMAEHLRTANPMFEFSSGKTVITGCRSIKSRNEIAIMKRLMEITLEVHAATAKIMRPGISAAEVEEFIESAHIKAGIPSGNYFCIVLFGPDSAFPHGVKTPQDLVENDMVLVDTGCQLHGYISDLTRTYVYGEISDRHREIWNIERNAMQAAFDAAKIGLPCGDLDVAARNYIAAQGLGPEYQLPGLPHRTGHGIGMDIHESPNLVRNDRTPLQAGMCFSNEPMICVPNEFGIRLEDHLYMTENGPEWFTFPSKSVDDPFG
jgi:Xaa-Pro aminopeptidase